MPMELRKRKTTASTASTASDASPSSSTKKRTASMKLALSKAKSVVIRKKSPAAVDPGFGRCVVGERLNLEGFGGSVETHTGEKTTLKDLVDKSEKGIAIFIYPKASTPGCINQACLFRDASPPLDSTGLSIYGLSTDSIKANCNFRNRYKIPFSLLCDPKATLIGALGYKKAAGGTTRGTIVIDKNSTVLVTLAGGPGATVAAVEELVRQQAEETDTNLDGNREDEQLQAQDVADKNQENLVKDEKSGLAEIADKKKEEVLGDGLRSEPVTA
ncbi:thioredoxin-like protein [Xylona heveae TC161]|uniref:Thioredoxin-like protein n=1 Tax=Xylona heveae (strain CBS 132557 / TC161) TaxID=1328760 RepID=A0A165J2Z3_XYLHT|nr:thioredoxin-like protein [Xylona heveae TC161]KZF25659.1 thioredoxin-like protein [Xylona heveae TC161]